MVKKMNLNKIIFGTATKWKERAKKDRLNRTEIIIIQNKILNDLD